MFSNIKHIVNLELTKERKIAFIRAQWRAGKLTAKLAKRKIRAIFRFFDSKISSLKYSVYQNTNSTGGVNQNVPVAAAPVPVVAPVRVPEDQVRHALLQNLNLNNPSGDELDASERLLRLGVPNFTPEQFNLSLRTSDTQLATFMVLRRILSAEDYGNIARAFVNVNEDRGEYIAIIDFYFPRLFNIFGVNCYDGNQDLLVLDFRALHYLVRQMDMDNSFSLQAAINQVTRNQIELYRAVSRFYPPDGEGERVIPNNAIPAAQRLMALGIQNFDQFQLNAAERLVRLGREDFNINQLNGVRRFFGLGDPENPNYFDENELQVIERLVALGIQNFWLSHIGAGINLVDEGNNNFSLLALENKIREHFDIQLLQDGERSLFEYYGVAMNWLLNHNPNDLDIENALQPLMDGHPRDFANPLPLNLTVQEIQEVSGVFNERIRFLLEAFGAYFRNLLRTEDDRLRFMEDMNQRGGLWNDDNVFVNVPYGIAITPYEMRRAAAVVNNEGNIIPPLE